MACTSNHVFHNWAQTTTCKPDQYCQPKSEQAVQQLVQRALKDGKHVRTVGAGHSWAPLVLTEDILVNLDQLNLVASDMTTLRAQAQAGIRLKDLTPQLTDAGLALANLGSIRGCRGGCNHEFGLRAEPRPGPVGSRLGSIPS